jgi:16S rRNA U516 pseudouridylate synthase RsuA-like enzyme
LRLIRYAIGNVTLDGLEPGQYKSAGTDIKMQLLSR